MVSAWSIMFENFFLNAARASVYAGQHVFAGHVSVSGHGQILAAGYDLTGSHANWVMFGDALRGC